MKTVIEMAREAGCVEASHPFNPWSVNQENLERFAELVRADAMAAEREACAQLVEPNEEHRRDASWGYLGGTEGVELLDQMTTAIRARSNT